jgi:NAD(P)H-dependent FMN reductase
MTHAPHDPLSILVIVASTRPGRFGPVVADWFSAVARERPELDVHVLDLVDPGDDVSARLAAADAFVVVVPEYNHSYPGPLKTMIDEHRDGWFAKPVAFVAYGGLSGGLRAVEHLRVVFAELHTVTIRDTVSFHGAWKQFDETGRPVDEQASRAAAAALLDGLSWWGQALRAARERTPFVA